MQGYSTIAGDGSLTVNIVRNLGSLTMASTGAFQLSSDIVNEPSGLIIMTNTQPMQSTGGGATPTLVNKGRVMTALTGTAQIQFPITNTGTVTVNTGSLTTTGTYTQNGGITQVDATLTVTSTRRFLLNAGVLSGSGIIATTVEQGAAVIQPGGWNHVGSLTVGMIKASSTSKLEIEASSGSAFDQLIVQGNSLLTGLLTSLLGNVNIIAGELRYFPILGNTVLPSQTYSSAVSFDNSFPLLNAYNGQFSSVTAPTGYTASASYFNRRIDVTANNVMPPPPPPPPVTTAAIEDLPSTVTILGRTVDVKPLALAVGLSVGLGLLMIAIAIVVVTVLRRRYARRYSVGMGSEVVVLERTPSDIFREIRDDPSADLALRRQSKDAKDAVSVAAAVAVGPVAAAETPAAEPAAEKSAHKSRSKSSSSSSSSSSSHHHHHGSHHNRSRDASASVSSAV
jgi:hypothetical protein